MKKKVLVIDDEMSIRFLIKEVVEESGYECIQAENAIEGLKYLENISFDLIILDIQMPRMNGLDAIKRIRELDVNIPVIMLSAFGHMEDVVMNLGIEVNSFISKPFDIDVLSQKVNSVIGE